MDRTHRAAAPTLLAALAALPLVACTTAAPQPAPAPVRAAGPDLSAAFATVRAVLQHPRCLACHPPGDAPLQGDDSIPHLQDVRRGADGRGLPGARCLDCHGKANLPESYGPNMPPGVSSEWRMPGAEQKMVFVGMAPGPLCEQLKDPARNGGKDLAALQQHVAADPLVLWGWAPGAGRAPVNVPHAQFVAAFKAWAAAGAPCPK